MNENTDDHPARGRQIAKGNTKVVYGVVGARDRAIVKMLDRGIPDLDVLATTVHCNIFEALQAGGMDGELAFHGQRDDTSFVVERCNTNPIIKTVITAEGVKHYQNGQLLASQNYSERGALARKAFDILAEACARVGCKLVRLKVEFGRDNHGTLMITGFGLRVRINNRYYPPKKKDEGPKEVLRRYRLLANLTSDPRFCPKEAA